MQTNNDSIKEIYLAGGCFWGLEAYFKRLPGVLFTDVGYANGNTMCPTYDDVCHNETGHAEAVYIRYESGVISLFKLLKAFFEVIDPTSLNRQSNDFGVQYRTGIYYAEKDDLTVINKVLEDVQKSFKKPIVTEILPLSNFYPAESYHQDYLDKHPTGYCHINPYYADEFAKKEGLLSADVVIKKEDYKKPEDEILKKRLSEISYDVTQKGMTERPFTSGLNMNSKKGLYVDIVTGEPLFTSNDKFESGCGWPSFSKPVTNDVLTEHEDNSFNMKRLEIRSRSGDSHLGHVFNDGPEERGGLRYCINGAALRFIPKNKMEDEGYGYLKDIIDKSY